MRHFDGDQARDALRDILYAAYHGTKAAADGRKIFTIPRNEERDADCILSHVIEERDHLLRACQQALRAANEPHPEDARNSVNVILGEALEHLQDPGKLRI